MGDIAPEEISDLFNGRTKKQCSRDLILSGGVCDAARYVATDLLTRGYSIILCPGGASEALYASKKAEVLVLKKRKGNYRGEEAWSLLLYGDVSRAGVLVVFVWRWGSCWSVVWRWGSCWSVGCFCMAVGVVVECWFFLCLVLCLTHLHPPRIPKLILLK